MTMASGSCLCGGVGWEVDADGGFMSHCHCGRCRKAHGAAFATFVMVPTGAFRLVRGADLVERYATSADLVRPFCRRCGSRVACGDEVQGMIGVPAGPLDDDPGVRPMAHIFVGSKAPWYDVPAGLPQFEAYPPSIDAPALADLPTRDAAGAGTRGSCLCGGVGYVVTGPVLRSQHCHCSRCRKARAAAHGSNFFTAIDDVRFTRGEGLLSSYKVPEARFFKSVFCRTCGSPMPRHDPERGIAAVPMGGLDDDPGIRPARHIFTASKAPWFDIADDLPQFPEMAPNL